MKDNNSKELFIPADAAAERFNTTIEAIHQAARDGRVGWQYIGGDRELGNAVTGYAVNDLWQLAKPDGNELLDLLERVSRSATIPVGHMTARLLDDNLKTEITNIVERFRPVPFHYHGGKRYRGSRCIDNEENTP